MIRKLLPALIGGGLLLTACPAPEIAVETVGPEGVTFVAQIADVEGDVGAGVSLTSDAEGNPHMSYLGFAAELEEGEVAPPTDPFAPTLPAVKHAHLIGEVWTRSGVADDLREQPEEPEEEPDPDAPPPEPGPPLVDREDETAIALDGPGTHHVAWTQGPSVHYTSDAGGDFAEPETVFQREAAGLSMATNGDGAPSIAFYESQPGPEGPGALIRVATRDGEQWEVETAAEADAVGPLTTGIAVVGGETLVAYSSGGTVFLARSGEVWESEEVAEGVGASLAVDGDGNPHLAFYTDAEVRHAHSIDGSPWDVTPVGDAGGQSRDDWSTSIAISPDGTHHVAWQMQDDIGYATNEEGPFGEEGVRGTAAGLRPRLAAGAEQEVHMAWYDTDTRVVVLAIRSDRAPLLAAPPPEPGAGPAPPQDDTGPPPCRPDGTELTVGAPVGAAASGFDTECLAAPAGEDITIEFVNDDEGVPHNVAIYQDSTAEQDLFVGEVFPGVDSMVYEVGALEEEGQFFFRCDVHPTTMTGTFVVE